MLDVLGAILAVFIVKIYSNIHGFFIQAARFLLFQNYKMFSLAHYGILVKVEFHFLLLSFQEWVPITAVTHFFDRLI